MTPTPGHYRATRASPPYAVCLIEVREGKESLLAYVAGGTGGEHLRRFADWEPWPTAEAEPYWWRCPRGHWYEGGAGDGRYSNCLKCDRPMTPLKRCERSGAWRDRELAAAPTRRITHHWTSEPPREDGLWLMTTGDADDAVMLKTFRVDGNLFDHWEVLHPGLDRPTKGLTVAINQTEAVDVSTMGARWLRIGEVG